MGGRGPRRKRARTSCPRGSGRGSPTAAGTRTRTSSGCWPSPPPARSALLIAPTGAGKTLAGFLPSLSELAEGKAGRGLHTLYISPLKALAVDVHRNLLRPLEEMELPVAVETRTGDTPAPTAGCGSAIRRPTSC